MKKICFLIAGLFLSLFAVEALQAQANLSFQGILKKANGLAVDDGAYDLTFTLYDAETGGNNVFQETISDVDVASGIYSVVLGAGATAITAQFNVPYYLGIRVGGSSAVEMVPRIRLTSAPYALALRGNTNTFPSSGTVIADAQTIAGKLAVGQTILPTTQSLQVNGGILARGGAPGGSGSSNNGYAFSGNSGDTDSGLFSTADGKVSVYANNSERILVSNTASDNRTYLKSNVTVENSLTVNDQLLVTNATTLSGDATLGVNANLAYHNGTTVHNDWRLVHRDDFSSGLEGWDAYPSINSGTETTDPSVTTLSAGFSTNSLIRPTNNDHVLKKTYNLAGHTHSYIMVKFNYYFIDSWDASDYDRAWAGFANSLSDAPEFGWSQIAGFVSDTGNWDFIGNTGRTDHAGVFTMMAKNSGSLPVIIVGATLDDATDDENFGISNIEIWVR